jgi:hypothetical protein
MMSGFFPRDKEIAGLFQLPVKTPSLHVIGNEDPVVTPGKLILYHQYGNLLTIFVRDEFRFN